MTRDTQSKSSKKEVAKPSKKSEMVRQKRKKDESSDSEYFEGSDTGDEEMDVHEYRKFLSKIFPSKHLSNKVKAGEKLKKYASANEKKGSDDEDSDSEEEERLKKRKQSKKQPKKKVKSESEEEQWETASEEQEPVKKSRRVYPEKKSKKKPLVESETESEETLGSEDTEEEEDEDELEHEWGEINKKTPNKLNIIFTIGGVKDRDEDGELDEDEDEDDDSDYVDSLEDTEDEDESVSSDSDTNSDSDEEQEECEPIVQSKNKKTTKLQKGKASEKESKSCEEMLLTMQQLLEENPNDKSLMKCIEVYEADIKRQEEKRSKKTKKQKDKNMRIFKKIIRDKNMMNDFSFYEKMETEDQKKIIKELREINKITRIEKPYRMTLLEANIPTIFKGAAMKKINSLRYMEPGSGEFYKIKNWVDTFMRIPFNKFESLPITMDDGVEKCHEFMENAKNTLDSATYGLNDAKMQIMQMLGQLVTNPKSIGTAIAINGPPGTGKTTLVKEGISKILNRPFAFIALGGATDSSFLEGHSYTYEGSTWGKIVQILIDSKCMNPVIYFDELDKISDTPRGEEITGILTHLTDTSQNSQFHDKYFAEINFDLSKCLFIFSYNDESKVNPILKDRMYRIQTKGYGLKQKTVISKSYLLPRIREQVKFNDTEVIISDETIHHIVDKHCNKEDGVRNLKRCLEIIHTKLNLYRLMKPGSNLFEEDMSLKVEFPFTVTKDIVDKLIKSNSDTFSTWQTMFV